MAAFHFRLAAVLRYRERLREEKQAELALAEMARAQAVADIQKLERIIDRPASIMEKQVGLTLSASELLDIQQLTEDAQRALSLLEDRRGKLEQIEQLLVEKRAVLIQADQAVKSLELLQERQAEAHRQHEDAQEQARLDEVGQNQHRQRDLG